MATWPVKEPVTVRGVSVCCVIRRLVRPPVLASSALTTVLGVLLSVTPLKMTANGMVSLPFGKIAVPFAVSIC